MNRLTVYDEQTIQPILIDFSETGHINNLQLICGRWNRANGNQDQEYSMTRMEYRQAK